MIYVLFSGGLDSLYCLRWALHFFRPENVRAIYFDLGTPYAEKELRAAHELTQYLNVKLIVREDLKFVLTEDKDAHVPLRNLTFLILTAAIPECRGIVFGMLRGEYPEDKNPVFVRRVRQLLNSQYLEGGRAVSIHTPVAQMTKTQLVRRGLEQWGYHFGLMLPKTIGCHSGDEVPCGECMSCFNRWVAMYLNGRPEDYIWHPADAMLRRIRASVKRQLTGIRLLQRAPGMSIVDRIKRLSEAIRALNRYTHERYGLSLWRHLMPKEQ